MVEAPGLDAGSGKQSEGDDLFSFLAVLLNDAGLRLTLRPNGTRRNLDPSIRIAH